MSFALWRDVSASTSGARGGKRCSWCRLRLCCATPDLADALPALEHLSHTRTRFTGCTMDHEAAKRQLLWALEQCRSFGLPREDYLSISSLAHYNERVVAFENLCVQLFEHDLVLPREIVEVIAELGESMAVARSYWAPLSSAAVDSAWTPLPIDVATSVERELAREVSPGHPLDGHVVRVIARSSDCDDVAVRLDDGRLCIVHLTWKRESSPEWPRCEFVAMLDPRE